MSMSSTLDFVLVPLHPIYDKPGGVGDLSFTSSFIVRTPDTARTTSDITAALGRVCDKWRLVAGRLEWDEDRSTWAVRAPLGPLPSSYAPFHFSHSLLSGAEEWHHTTRPQWTPQTASTFSVPPSSLFRDPSIPTSFKAIVEKRHPLVSLHISEQTTDKEVLYVGLTFPHGVFDGSGMGMIVRYLNCEMNDIEWTPPTLPTENILQHAYFELESKVLEPPRIPPAPLYMLPINFLILLGFLISLAYEFFWKQVTPKGIFIGEEVWEKMVAREKEAAMKEGIGWISSGDIMVAFLLKSALKDTSHKGLRINVSSVYNIRPPLSLCTSYDLTTYPHNAAHAFDLPSFSLSTLQSLPLHKLALMHRQSLPPALYPSSILSFYNHLKRLRTEIPLRGPNESSWVISNQIMVRLPELAFGEGTTVEEYWAMAKPFVPDHMFALNKFKGGVLFLGSLRKTEWESIEEELEKLKQ